MEKQANRILKNHFFQKKEKIKKSLNFKPTNITTDSGVIEKMKKEEQVRFEKKIKKIKQEELFNLVKVINQIEPSVIKETSKENFSIKLADMSLNTLQTLGQYLNSNTINSFE